MKNGLYTYPDGSPRINLAEYKYWVEHSNGTKYWYLNSKRHREDGPAVEYPDGTKEWYLNGEEITLETRSKDPKVKRLQEYMKVQELIEG